MVFSRLPSLVASTASHVTYPTFLNTGKMKMCFVLFLGTLGWACGFLAYQIDKQTVCDLGCTQGKTDNGWGFACDQLDCSNLVCCYRCTVHATYGWARWRWPIRLVWYFWLFFWGLWKNSVNTVFLIILYTPSFFLVIKVFIKISSHPWYPLICD